MIIFIIISIIFAIIGVIVLAFFASIDKAFLDSLIVIISLLGLILNNLSHGNNSFIEKLMQKSATWFVIVLGAVLFALGSSWIAAYLIGNCWFHELKTPIWLLFLGIPSLIIGVGLISIRDKLRDSKGSSFAIYYAFILIIYIIFLFFDPSTQNVLSNLKKYFFKG